MADFRVIWEIDISADNPTEAARQALDIMRNPDSTATVFDVFTPDIAVRVDLEDNSCVDIPK